jgi:hypothetical protein
MASEVAYLNGEKFRPVVPMLLRNCDDLRGYPANNTGRSSTTASVTAPNDPSRHPLGEGCVDAIANARMVKKQPMRWSPQGTPHVAVVRAAVLDGHLGAPMGLPPAA